LGAGLATEEQNVRAKWVALGVIFILILLLFWRCAPKPPDAPPPIAETPTASLDDQTDALLREISPSYISAARLQDLYDSLLKGYWVPQTGLFLSFPGTGDLRLSQQAATYDQGVVALVLLKLGDTDKVKGVLRFYQKTWAKQAKERSGPRKGRGGFANFYNAYYGVEGVEKTMHVGPNAWIGLVAARYYRQTGEKWALKLALDIARWCIYKVPHSDGAISMGEIPWNTAPWPKIHSTENNLSYYAFLVDLLKAPKLTSKDRTMLATEKARIEKWLITKSYRRDVEDVIRGFHHNGLDTIGAIDSYTWYLGALRPPFVRSKGISVDKLMDRAKSEFTVEVAGRKGIDCVDFNMAHLTFRDDTFVKQLKDPLFLRPEDNRNRLIWYEGQAQYIIACQDLGRDLARRAVQATSEAEKKTLTERSKKWLNEAADYTRYFEQAAMRLSWGIAYPCATNGRFYLHGWPAPRPAKDRLSDAVAPLAWRMFVGMGFEPLSDTQMIPSAVQKVRKGPRRKWRDPGTDILYGASEEMVVRAWDLYEKGDLDYALRQARTTIALWQDDAKVLQKVKQETVGDYLSFDGTIESLQKIHDYWALNDVCAAWFVVGRIAHQRGDYAAASEAFSTILKEYSLAQMWDKRGWFWNPVDTLQVDYIGADKERYGHLAALVPAGLHGGPMFVPDMTPEQVPSSEQTPVVNEITEETKEN
jgi:tetratricopeptide (TPR) repeat protein